MDPQIATSEDRTVVTWRNGTDLNAVPFLGIEIFFARGS